MWRLLQRGRDKFFGSWDRGLTTVSLAAALVGAAISAFLVMDPATVPQYISYRDLVFWCALILMSIVITAKYVRREELIRRQISLLSNQYKCSHELIHNYRNELFHSYFRPNAQRHKFTNKELKIFRHLCSYITEGVKTSFSEHFSANGIDLEDDLSVSVKLVITPQEVLEIFDRFINLSQEQQQQIQSKDLCIITVYRDNHTHTHIPTREKALKIYDIDKNTAFRHLIRLREPTFCDNDLQSLGVAYENENSDWKTYYNATLVVPIRYLSVDDRQFRCYGVLAIDSLNKKKIKDLFSEPQCKYILAHAADLLATFFLFLEFTESVPNQVANVASPPPGVP